MGEIAEMMLDGTLCEGCGDFIGEGTGIPGYCSEECARDRGATWFDGRDLTARTEPPAPNPAKTNCPHCNKRVKKVGLADHIRVKHPEEISHG